MELVRVVAGRARGAEVAELAHAHQLLVRCADGDTIMVVASWHKELTTPVGVWLIVGAGYRAQLAARDLKTLAALAPISRVVIEAPSRSSEHAAVVEAMLTNDEVNFVNDVATLRGAFNRPAPASPIEVWSYEDERLTRGDRSLAPVRHEASDLGELTYFASVSRADARFGRGGSSR